MNTSKPISERINNRLRSIYNSALKRLGYGTRIEAVVWDEQYESGRWAYLGNPEEAEHYRAVCRMFKKHKPGGVCVDIGCGHGVQYHHLTHENVVSTDTYLGIDISEKGIAQARELYPGTDFRVLDYEKEKLTGNFDVIVFNNTLYYFTSTTGTIKKCVLNNLKKDGIFIFSIVDHPDHDKYWERLDKLCATIEEEEIYNNQGLSWKVKAMMPRTV